MTNPVLKAKNKWLTAHIVIIVIFIASLICLGFSIVGEINNWTNWLITALGSVGGSLLATGLTYVLILPKMKYREQELFQDTYENKGFRGVEITASSIISDANPVHRTFNLVTDNTVDLHKLLSGEKLWPRSGRRKIEFTCLLKLPIAVNNPEYAELVKQIVSRGVQVGFYIEDLPCYSRIDDNVHISQSIEGNDRIIHHYTIGSEIGNSLDSWFQSLCRGELVTIANTTYGRYPINQKDAIETILSFFCMKLAKDLNISVPIEAVVVQWTEKKKKRITLYSCNKPETAEKHNIWDYNRGIVGKLQEEVTASKSPDCVILYDKEYKSKRYRFLRFDRAEKIEEKEIEEQTWDNTDTKAMFAIPFLSKTHEMFGALTYDVGTSLKDCSPEQIKTSMGNIRSCRDLVLNLLGTKLISDYDKLLSELENEEMSVHTGMWTSKLSRGVVHL